MLERSQGGSIVNVSSNGSAVAFAKCASFCSAKAALDMLTKVMALELGPQQVGTCINFNHKLASGYANFYRVLFFKPIYCGAMIPVRSSCSRSVWTLSVRQPPSRHLGKQKSASTCYQEFHKANLPVDITRTRMLILLLFQAHFKISFISRLSVSIDFALFQRLKTSSIRSCICWVTRQTWSMAVCCQSTAVI